MTGSLAGADHIQEVGPHRPVAVDVAQAGKTSWSAAAHRDEDPVRLERDRSPGAVDPGDAGVPDGEATSHECASIPTPPRDTPPPAACCARARCRDRDGTRARTPPRDRRWPAGRSSAPRPRRARRHPPSRVVAPARPPLALHRDQVEDRTSPSAPEAIVSRSTRAKPGAIVLRHHEPAAGACLGLAHRLEIRSVKERRLLQHHVLARVQRGEEPKMRIGRRTPRPP